MQPQSYQQPLGFGYQVESKPASEEALAQHMTKIDATIHSLVQLTKELVNSNHNLASSQKKLEIQMGNPDLQVEVQHEEHQPETISKEPEKPKSELFPDNPPPYIPPLSFP
ncbi:hypothetical protein PanWU01x14_226690 [Parasponia andersonii]|uniref:Uncharacterized protein n=1 Tax=Parasponia andersonii TaxID=3476 RepID=A0A2P5BMK0_PARAD|nr:hypothetical protein PanWU01x14_226690 [Parasponia andersonii]